MRKLSFVALLLGLAVCPNVRAQIRPIQLGKALVRTANPGALSMPGMPGMPGMPTVTFPNTYNSVVSSYSYDPNAGQGGQGTIYISWNFTGTTQPSPMQSQNTQHTPQVRVNVLYNGVVKSSHYVAGLGVSPTAQMNQTLTLGFDIGTDACDLTLFMDGTCEFAEQNDQVYCNIAGAFVFLIKKFQFEYATAETQTIQNVWPFKQEPWCVPPSDPPDWYLHNGAVFGTTGFRVASAWLVRSQILGLSFKYEKWYQLQEFGLPMDVDPGPKVVCTQNDQGCVWGATSCTGQPTK